MQRGVWVADGFELIEFLDRIIEPFEVSTIPVTGASLNSQKATEFISTELQLVWALIGLRG